MVRALAGLAAVVGLVLVLVCLVGSLWPRFAGDQLPAQWPGGALYLKSASPEPSQCRVTGPDGLPSVLTVPGSPARGLTLHGARIDPTTPVRLSCTGPVTVTSGEILRAYPLAERGGPPIVIGLGLLVVGSLGARLLNRRR